MRMRGSGWAPAILAALMCLAAVLWPVVALFVTIDLTPSPDDPNVAMSGAAGLFLRSSIWSISIALVATLLGWLPGRLLGALAGKPRFIIIAALLAVPVCLPEYVLYWCWWQASPPGGILHNLFLKLDAMPLLRAATLAAALIGWSWPIVSWCVAGASLNQPEHGEDLLRLTGQPWWRRAMLRLRYDARGLALGCLFVSVAVFSNTVCFDLATIFTFGNELRAREALGATPRQLLVAGLPAVVVTALAAGLLWILFNRSRPQRAAASPPITLGTVVFTAVLWIACLAAPVALLLFSAVAMVRQSGTTTFAQFFDYYGDGFFNTFGIAAISGFLSAVIAVALTQSWLDHRPWLRIAAHAQAVAWLIFAAAPSTIAGLALEAAYNHGGLIGKTIYSSPVILVLAHLSRFAFVGALVGRWLAMNEPMDLRDLRRLDDSGTLGSFIRTSGPRLLAAAVATFCITAALSAGEITITNLIRPVGFDVLAPSVLNAMHYQQMDTVLIAVLAQVLFAVLASLLVAVVARLTSRRLRARPAAVALVAIVIFLPACSSETGDAKPIDTEFTFGAPGQALGQFDYPRAMSINRNAEKIYIVDKSARIQRFDINGKPELFWRTPIKDNGKPTGISVAPDGRVFVADTHYYRILVYDADGRELMRFGEYGVGPGQFIYPTDIAFGPDNRLYVSEYGGNDRVQVFDEQGGYLFAFGGFGDEPGRFNRPQSIVFDPEQSRLFVADSCNHRIQVFDAEGQYLSSFGSMGRERGQLAYPYGLSFQADGTLLTAEFGNCRIQRFSPDGMSLGVSGKLGTARGELMYPWSVDAVDDRVFILDSGNNRVQVVED